MISNWQPQLPQLQFPKYENRRHTGKDLVGIAIIVAAAMIAANFIFQQTKVFTNGIAEQSFIDSLVAEELRYKFNIAQSKSTPEKTYAELRAALLNNDLNGVLKLIHPDYLWKYEDGLRKAAAEKKLAEAAARMTPLEAKIEEYGNIVRYKLSPIPGNNNSNPLKRYGEDVEFTRDYDGVWKISSL
ncbi:MAG: hypothetical protein HYV65_02360 [Candidatus Spechtbacteria bacterium]|nr:hypothetical protein [Candidatus Spechtbacteria bacterium]